MYAVSIEIACESRHESMENHAMEFSDEVKKGMIAGAFGLAGTLTFSHPIITTVRGKECHKLHSSPASPASPATTSQLSLPPITGASSALPAVPPQISAAS